MLKKAKNNYLCLPSLLHSLQEIASTENALPTLIILNKVISSNQDELELLYKSGGIDVITNFLADLNLTNICLKILLNASKRHEKLPRTLRNNKIFQLLATILQSETDFCNGRMILISALIVLLVQGHPEAQNLMRTSGCLSKMINILTRILGEEEGKSFRRKNTELLIYAIIVSSKDPKQAENQREVGCITPLVLEYLKRQNFMANVDQVEIAKCLWLLLKCVLDQNERNQEIFLNSSGLSVLFRSIQDIVAEGKCEEMGDLLAKMTGVLIKLQSHTHFLSQTSNYCPLMILGSLLKAGNTLVVQQVITFLDTLTREIPQALHTLKDPEILRAIKKAKIMFLKSQIAAEFCQSLLTRMEMLDEMLDEMPTSQEDPIPGKTFQFASNNESSISCEPEPDLMQNFYCVVHDADTLNMTVSQSGPFFLPVEERLHTSQDQTLHKIKQSAGNVDFYRRELREREKKLKKMIKENISNPSQRKMIRYNALTHLNRGIVRFIHKFISFFTGVSVEDLKRKFSKKMSKPEWK